MLIFSIRHGSRQFNTVLKVGFGYPFIMKMKWGMDLLGNKNNNLITILLILPRVTYKPGGFTETQNMCRFGEPPLWGITFEV